MNKKYKNYIFDEDIFKKLLEENKKMVKIIQFTKLLRKQLILALMKYYWNKPKS